MKAKQLCSVLVISFFFLVPTSTIVTEQISCYDKKITTILHVYKGELKEAKRNIKYCLRSSPEFKIAVHLEGLPKNHSYKLCLNGWPGRPGNEKLKEFGYRGQGENQEGYYDFADAMTDRHGAIDTVVSVVLDTSEYHVKFLVKDIIAKSNVVLYNDDLKFTIEKLKISIDHPSDGAELGHTVVLRGIVSDPSLNIYVFVHPMLTDLWWCQRHPSPPGTDGSWRTLCYFGTKSEGVDEYFEVVALAAGERNLWKERLQFKLDSMEKILVYYPHSTIFIYKRTR